MLVWLMWVAGCASPTPDTAIVAETLQGYQPGKTTFADFTRDAGLILVDRPAPPAWSTPPAASGNFPQPSRKMYRPPPGSPWKIYGTQENVSIVNGYSSRTVKYVVGDINHPISALTFDSDGNLKSISPEP